jgi:hypothetical protein
MAAPVHFNGRLITAQELIDAGDAAADEFIRRQGYTTSEGLGYRVGYLQETVRQLCEALEREQSRSASKRARTLRERIAAASGDEILRVGRRAS